MKSTKPKRVRILLQVDLGQQWSKDRKWSVDDAKFLRQVRRELRGVSLCLSVPEEAKIISASFISQRKKK
jgi:hypothetical protein